VRRLLIATAVALAPVLLAACESGPVQDCPPLGQPPILAVAAAGDPCQVKPGETALQRENRRVQVYQRTAAPNPGGPRYPLRCGTTKYGYLHLLDAMKRPGDQGQDHCDPVNDSACAAMISYTLQSGAYGAVGGSNHRYTVKFNEIQKECHQDHWGFRVVVAANPTAPGPGWRPDGLPVGIITASFYRQQPAIYP
jgi:hypothetical protein